MKNQKQKEETKKDIAIGEIENMAISNKIIFKIKLIIFVSALLLLFVAKFDKREFLIFWSILTAITLFSELLMRKTMIGKKVLWRNILLLLLLVFEFMVVMLWLIYAGLIFLLASIFLAIYSSMAYLAFSKNFFRFSTITTFLIVCLLALFAQYEQIIVPVNSLMLKGNIIDNPAFFIINAAIAIPVTIAVIFIVSLFANKLEDTLVELANKEEKLEDERAMLEIRINARTRELKEQAERLRKENDEKNRDLEDRIKELEAFRKLTVGRELKMIELKKKVKTLEKKQ